jgi:tRNA-Thr(GGU) m(6)t(6)A37 methyltransferase TsaA
MLLEQVLSIFKKHDLSLQASSQGISASGEEEHIFLALRQALIAASEMDEVTLEIKLARSIPSLGNGHDLLCYRAIGHVENDFDQSTNPQSIRSGESRLLLDPTLSAGLKGIEAGQKILVLYDFHLSEGFALLQHPRGDRQRPKKGIFALRSPNRPNSIGVSEVEVTSKERNVLTVRGLDALNRSPILDIKPA